MKVAVIGAGLIGGSIGLALRKNDPGAQVVVFDADAETSRASVDRGAATAAAASLPEAVRDADIVVIATPVAAIVPVAAAIRDGLRAGVVVTDVGSTKAEVVRQVGELLPPEVTFIGGHPMAGSEQEGIGAARADLFWGAAWILTPAGQPDPEALATLQSFISSLGARVMILDPEEHDDLMAVVSHLPQLVATTLMNFAAEADREHRGLLSLAAGGFRDTTRLAASNETIWVDICRTNSRAIAETLKSYAGHLLDLGRRVELGDFEGVRQALAAGRDARRALPEKRGAEDLFEIRFPIPDRPGVLAEVTAAIASVGVNIEDLRISHVVEGTRGVIHVTVNGDSQARLAGQTLATRGYEPEVTRA